LRIAVIGSGISGLAAAYYLSRKHLVTLYEKDARLGGHTHTVRVDSIRGGLAVDTGFIVHNERTYPNLVRLFTELGVETAASDMSFGVTCRATGFEYSSRGLGGFFAQRSNAIRGAHYRLFTDILRFNRTAPHLLDQPGAERATIGDVLAEGRYGSEFIHRYLFPMASAVWSMSFDDIRAFPAMTLIRFFDNHGMLGIDTHPQWKVVKGGSSSYLGPITRPYRERVRTDAAIAGVARTESGVTVRVYDGAPETFDHVVFACHGDQVLPMLDDATAAERDVLTRFRYTRNETCLHTDSRLLPSRPAARASWNYNLGLAGNESVSVTYHMNRLQSLSAPEDFCVSLNANGAIDPARVLRRMVYEHPLYSRDAVAAQARWGEISGRERTHYCGAYWFYGFHEDGLNSALRVARSLGAAC
jgi:uncharacterized protein